MSLFPRDWNVMTDPVENSAETTQDDAQDGAEAAASNGSEAAETQSAAE